MVDAGLWLTGVALLVIVGLTYASIRLLSDVLGESAAEREAARIDEENNGRSA